jgi:diaminopimelate epimerase
MKIRFTKAHGAKNDFLLTWLQDAPEADLPQIARAICDRHTGIGADGWLLVKGPSDAEAEGEITLYNSDGSLAEISGNGTRCAAAFLIRHGFAPGLVRIRTGAGIKTLRLLDRRELWFEFEMNMGRPEVIAERFALEVEQATASHWQETRSPAPLANLIDCTLLHVGNPQCVVPVNNFDFDWRGLGAEIESHPHFPQRTNVSFIKPAGPHEIEARFYERGAGETMSSGTGSTGAAVAAVLRAMVSSPVRVLTPAGPIELRLESGPEGYAFLTGPAEIVAEGEFFV